LDARRAAGTRAACRAFARAQRRAKKAALKVPARLIVLGVLMLASGTVSGYVLTYLTTYAQDSLKMSARLAFAATIVFGLAEVCADLTSGRLSDRFGRRPMMLVPLLLLTSSSYRFSC
jgi:predicted MFS family arabinose efflux permease